MTTCFLNRADGFFSHFFFFLLRHKGKERKKKKKEKLLPFQCPFVALPVMCDPVFI